MMREGDEGEVSKRRAHEGGATCRNRTDELSGRVIIGVSGIAVSRRVLPQLRQSRTCAIQWSPVVAHVPDVHEGARIVLASIPYE